MPTRYATYHRLLSIFLCLIDRILLIAIPRPHQVSGRFDKVPARILICNQGHLGDAILATALVPALRAAYPSAKIGLLVHPGSVALVASDPDIEWLHTVEHWHLNRRGHGWWLRWRAHWTSHAKVLAEIRARDYHLALDTHPFFPNSLLLLWRASIPHRVGWTSAGFGRLLHASLDEPLLPQNMLARHARLLSLALGVSILPDSLRPHLIVPRSAALAWSEIRREVQLTEGFIAVHVGAYAAHKRWPARMWLAIVQSLTSTGHTVLLLGASPGEVEVCEEIAAECSMAEDLSGCLSLELLLAAIANCSLLLSHDSVAAHIGSAFDRPRICLVPGIQDPSIWHRSDVQSIVLTEHVPCAPCLRGMGCAKMTCLRAIAPSRVLHAAAALLQAGKSTP